MSCINIFQCSKFSLVIKLLVLATLLGVPDIQVGCLDFNFSSFRGDTRSNLLISSLSNLAFNAIQVTNDANEANLIKNLAGRVCYNRQFKIWSKKKNITASFNSTFVLNITPVTNPGGEGLAFIITGDSNCAVPNNSQGQWLGIVNANTNGSSSSSIVAVEFDTKKSFSEDLDDNHVGVDVNSVYSIHQISLSGHGVNISNAADITAIVRYDGVSKILNISVFMSNSTGENVKSPIISMPLDLSTYLSEDVYVGFSASTGETTELNCIKSWSFSSKEIDEDRNLLWVWLLIPIIVMIMFLICGFIVSVYRKRKRQWLDLQENDPEIEQQIQSSATAPQKFHLKELQSATHNFHSKNKLGEGGFGAVYKGILNDKEVAVKRTTKSSRQGKQEFIAEVTTIGSLHHKNLVKLVGWCYESHELLLVYDFMPNGSLDKLIFCEEKPGMEESMTTLSWERRHGIICGVAQALDYLHNGCEKRVLHRDIKASNIMLDSDFNARLGDFGLARTIQFSDMTHHSTKEIAGTPGYMAPESFHTGRATVETDIYAFGVLLLEVACGRKPGNQNQMNNSIEGIVEWVWDLYRNETIIDGVDFRLNEEFEEEEAKRVLMLGLACCHPNPYQRPSMKIVLQVLSGEAAPPIVPFERPIFMWPATMPPSFNEYLDISINGGQITPISELSGR